MELGVGAHAALRSGTGLVKGGAQLLVPLDQTLERELQPLPLNPDLPSGLDTPQALARHIYQANVAHIDRCDAVVANLDFFRGPEPDSGTCFEIGYAVARGKPVVGYLPDEGSFAQRIRQRFPHAVDVGGTDTQGWQLEEFGLPLNLMLAVPCRIVTGGLEAALQALREPSAAS